MQKHRDDEPNAGLNRVHYELRATGVKPESANPMRSGVHSRGYLPHVKREGASYFVTFRLADSLPKEVLLQFEAEQAERLRRWQQAVAQGLPSSDSEADIHRDFRRQVERYLDQGHGACHLRRPAAAVLVCNAIMHFEGERYYLGNWVVMPNHVHALVWPKPNHTLSDILKTWKQYTSRRIKPIVAVEENRFWQPESYNHWVRNDDEKARISRYIRHNPVTSRLCAQPEDWPWSSVWPGWGKAVPPPTA